MKSRSAAVFSFMGILALLLASCGSGPVGTAVVLWPQEGWPVSPGTVVPVLEDSELQESYRISLPAADQEIMSPKWRVRFFEQREAAEAFAADFEPYAGQYGRIVDRPANRGAQRVYSSPEARSDRTVYRLRDGERFKILDRSPEPTNEGGAIAHWYQILTRDGTTGWVFGYYLETEGAAAGDRSAGGDDGEDADQALEGVFSRVWRPEYFQEMINTGHYNLDRFDTRYGLFPAPDENRLSLRVPEHTTSFTYSDVIRGDRGAYVFEGSSLQMRIRDADRISIQYSYQGDLYSRALFTIDENIDELVAEEMQRRDQAYEEILNRGNALLSTAYGTIRLDDMRTFEWEGYDRLVPSVIPTDAGRRGQVLFRYYPAEEIEEQFDGVIAFRFAGRSPGADLVFLYRFRENGIRLSRVSRRDIQDNVVQRESISPLVLFFSFDRQGSDDQAEDAQATDDQADDAS